MKFGGLSSKGTRVIERKRFHSSGHCDLDLRPTDPKINRGLLLNKGYHHMKFEGSGSKVLELLSGKGFHSSGHCDLDL